MIMEPGDTPPSGIIPVPPGQLGLIVRDGSGGAYLEDEEDHDMVLYANIVELREIFDAPIPLDSGLLEVDPSDESTKTDETAKDVPAESTPEPVPKEDEQPIEPVETPTDDIPEPSTREDEQKAADPDDESDLEFLEEIRKLLDEEEHNEDIMLDVRSFIATRQKVEIDFWVEDQKAAVRIVVLSANLTGLEGMDVQFQWQRNDGSGWKDVPYATEREHRIELTEENKDDLWRVRVTHNV